MRENIVLVRLNDREKDILQGMADYYDVTRAEVFRMLLMDRYKEINDSFTE